MSLYSALELQMTSGAAGTSNMTIERLQGGSIGYSINKTPVNVLGQFKPLISQPVINYNPPQFSFQCLKSNKNIEAAWGLVNNTGVGMVFTNHEGNTLVGYGARNITALVTPAQTNNYFGQINIFTGVLNSYTMSASVGEPARLSFAGEGLDLSHTPNTSGKAVASYESELVKPENISLSGIDVSGYGLSGITIQSVDLSISFNRQSVFRLGQKYPTRPMTAIQATVGIKGFFEGINTSLSSLSAYDCGLPMSGTLFFTLVPSCVSAEATTYIIRNPYLDSVNIGAQVGSFVSADLQFSVPISINSGECVTGSNVIIV